MNFKSRRKSHKRSLMPYCYSHMYRRAGRGSCLLQPVIYQPSYKEHVRAWIWNRSFFTDSQLPFYRHYGVISVERVTKNSTKFLQSFSSTYNMNFNSGSKSLKRRQICDTRYLYMIGLELLDNWKLIYSCEGFPGFSNSSQSAHLESP